MKIVLFALMISLACNSNAMDKENAPIAAYLMSVVNTTSGDYRISYMVQDPQDRFKLKYKPLYVVHPQSAKKFEADLKTKEIKMLALDPKTLPHGYYLFIENLYDDQDALYLQVSRQEQSNRALIVGELKRKIHHPHMHTDKILEAIESFDPKVGSTTMVSITLDDVVLENLKVEFHSIAATTLP